MEWPRYSLWQIFASVACFAISFGIVRFTYFELHRWGWGLFPTLCLLTAVALFLGGIGLIFPRVAMWLGATTLRIMDTVRDIFSR